MQNPAINNEELSFTYKDAMDISSIITKTDLKGHITYANNNFCKISGYSQEELVGRPHNIVRHKDMLASAFKDMWNTIQAKKIWNGIVQNRHKDGSSYYVSATVLPLLDVAGEIIEFISVRRDITEFHLLKNNLEERVLEEIEKNKKKDEDASANLSLFLDSTPNPIIVFGDDKSVKFVNKPFLTLVGKEKEAILNSEYDFSSLLVKGKNYIYKEENLVPEESNKIAIITKHGKNIFHLCYKNISDINNKSLKMYTLNNITTNEYQKLKIDSYNEQLQDFYMRNKLSTSKTTTIINKLEPKIEKKVRELNKNEKTLLKRKHKDYAVSSKEYSAELDEYVLLEIQELDEIEIEIQDLIYELEDKNITALHQIVIRLLKFSTVLNNMLEFKELSFSISSLADILDKQEILTLDETTYQKMLLFLKNIILDLSNWRNIVFIDQNANDIHYMDSSLFSSILQLELIFNTEQAHEEDDDDFELF